MNMEELVTNVIIQARMGSTRLPEKVMLKLAGKPVLHHIIERTKKIAGINRVIIATTDSGNNEPIAKLSESLNVDIFKGSENNVLERYYMASKKFNCRYIIRVTADNPFTDTDYASLALKVAIETGADLCSVLNIPLGTAVEIIKTEALEKAYAKSTKNYHLEHVTPYIKENPELFKIVRHKVSLNNPFPDLRLTIDTPEDFKLAEALFNELYKNKPFNIETAIDYLIKNPGLTAINKNIEHRPMTHSENEK